MFRHLGSIVTSLFSISADEIGTAYFKVQKLLGVLIVTTIAMWVINAVGYQQVNLIFFFLGGIHIAVKGFRPVKGLAVGAGFGFGYAFLSDTDWSQGARDGMIWWAKFINAAVFGWFLISALLTVLPMERPWYFFLVLAGSLGLATHAVAFSYDAWLFKKLTYFFFFVLTVWGLLLMLGFNVPSIRDIKEMIQPTTSAPTYGVSPAACMGKRLLQDGVRVFVKKSGSMEEAEIFCLPRVVDKPYCTDWDPFHSVEWEASLVHNRGFLAGQDGWFIRFNTPNPEGQWITFRSFPKPAGSKCP